MSNEFRLTNGSIDSIAYGRLLVDLGVALIQGRMRLVSTDTDISTPLAPARVVDGDPSGHPLDTGAHLTGHVVAPVDGARFIPPPITGRVNARGRYTARKGYSVSSRKGQKVDLSGITPAGTRLYEYLTRNPGLSAPMIADDLGLSRKTVENLLSILRQRNLVETVDLTK